MDMDAAINSIILKDVDAAIQQELMKAVTEAVTVEEERALIHGATRSLALGYQEGDIVFQLVNFRFVVTTVRELVYRWDNESNDEFEFDAIVDADTGEVMFLLRDRQWIVHPGEYIEARITPPPTVSVGYFYHYDMTGKLINVTVGREIVKREKKK